MARFLEEMMLSKRLNELEKPIWNKYRRQILFLLNKVCEITNNMTDHSYVRGGEEGNKGIYRFLTPLNVF